MSKRDRNAEPTDVDGRSFSESELEWAGKNIDYLQRFVHGDRIQSMMLATTFAIGLVVYALAHLISNDLIAGSPVVADFLYNLGGTLWTSVVLVYLLDIQVNRKRRSAERYLHLVREALRRQGQMESVADAQADASDRHLTLLLELKAEVAALRARLDDGPA